jgi:hypothetical protein
MADPWWRGLPPADAQVECGGHQHVLRWAEGTLTLPAHPDAEAELVLAALGGERAACTGLAELWARHADDLAVLGIGPRWAADELDVSWEDVAGIRSGGVAVVRTAPMRPFTHGPSPGRTPLQFGASGPRPRQRGGTPALGQRLDRILPGLLDLLHVMALGPAFQLRLAGTVAAAWSGADRARARSGRRPELTAALTGRLAPAVEAWLGDDVGPVVATVHEGPGWGSLELAGTRGASRAGLQASLPLDWLARVWACGLAVVDGHLVVAVESVRWPRAQVLALPEPGAAPVTLGVRASSEPGAHWVVGESEDGTEAGDEPASGEEAGTP